MLGYLLHTVFQNQGIEPGVLMGIRSHTERITPGERAFILASTRKAIEERIEHSGKREGGEK